MAIQSLSLHSFNKDLFSLYAPVVLKLSKRVWKLTLKHFGLLQAVGVLGFGALEFGLGYLPSRFDKGETSKRISNLQVVKDIQVKQCGIHGLFYVGSGALCALGEIEAMNQLDLRNTGPLLTQSGWTLFLFANLFSLEKNLKLYQAASKVEGTLGHRLKVTAILGMINNLGYVLGSIFSFFQGTVAIVMTLAALAVMAGTIKFFYDFFILSSF